MSDYPIEDRPRRGILAIGDTHFENKAYEQGEALIQRCLEIEEEINPEVVILLGDIQHTHETAKQSPFDQACRFIEQLAERAPTYVQIGNHDFINQVQFLSDKHFFNPLKHWNNVYIVDRPTVFTLFAEDEEIQIITCPYTPPGRLIEALDTLWVDDEDQETGIDWTASKCIFGHQEMRGIMYGGRPSTQGDQWMKSFPLFISGHIHQACDIDENVAYTGSSRQVISDESPDKSVWHIVFEDPEDDRYEPKGVGIWIRKIPVGIKGILDITVPYDEVKSFDFGLLDEHYITLHIKGAASQFKAFKKGQLYAKMVRLGIKLRFDSRTEEADSVMNINDVVDGTVVRGRLDTFDKVFHKLVQTKSPSVQAAYDRLYHTTYKTELVFVNKG